MLAINQRVMMFFHSQLLNTNAIQAYLNQRQINLSVIQKYSLGYIRDGKAVYEYLKSCNINDDQLIILGLIQIKNNQPQPFFHDRIIIPLLDVHQNCLGFSGRTTNDDNVKYLNIIDTKIFQKQSYFFNEACAIDRILATHQVYLVEGFMDAISMTMHGVDNVLALLGINLSNDHIKKLRQ